MKMNKTVITRLSHDNSGKIWTNVQPQCSLISMCTYTQSNQLKVKITNSSII